MFITQSKVEFFINESLFNADEKFQKFGVFICIMGYRHTLYEEEYYLVYIQNQSQDWKEAPN